MVGRNFEIVPPSGVGSRFVRNAIIALILFVLLIIGGPIKVVPAGHVGVKDLFGRVSPNVLTPGVSLVFPFTRVIKMSIQTQEVKETAEVPSKEGLMMDLEGSLLYRLDPTKAAEIYRTVGKSYQEIIVQPQIRSAIREITASYDAKALYSSEREQIARETFELFQRMAGGRGIIAEAVLLRKIGLPPIVANAIQEKLKREQEAEQMKFVLQKESAGSRAQAHRGPGHRGLPEDRGAGALAPDPGVEGHRGHREARDEPELEGRHRGQPQVGAADHYRERFEVAKSPSSHRSRRRGGRMLASGLMRIPMPAAVLAGGASRRMGRSKAALPYGAGTLLEFQTKRLAKIFEEVFVVAKEPPAFPRGRPASCSMARRNTPRSTVFSGRSRKPRIGSSFSAWICRLFPTR